MTIALLVGNTVVERDVDVAGTEEGLAKAEEVREGAAGGGGRAEEDD